MDRTDTAAQEIMADALALISRIEAAERGEVPSTYAILPGEDLDDALAAELVRHTCRDCGQPLEDDDVKAGICTPCIFARL